MSLPVPLRADAVRLADFTGRMCSRPILATTAMYGPWQPDGRFDFESYRGIVREVLDSGSLPATNVDTTWAQYNRWDLALEIIAETARVAADFAGAFPAERPLLVVGLNTNDRDIPPDAVAPAIGEMAAQVRRALAPTGVERVRFMPVPDKRLIGADSRTKAAVYREMGRRIGDLTAHGMVLFELDIGIPGFGSDFSLDDIAAILDAAPQIQEYKSAVIAPKPDRKPHPYDFRDDLARIALVEASAPERVQFSTGNDWCIALARLGARLPRFGYLLGASQMAPPLFQAWRRMVEADDPGALPLEQDLQAAARDFWTPGNVGVYRHYVGILLALTGRIRHPLPHPDCAAHFRVRPEDYWLPMKHARRLGLISAEEAVERALEHIPGTRAMAAADLREKIRLMS